MKKSKMRKPSPNNGKSYVKKYTNVAHNVKATVKDILFTGGMIASGVKVITPYVLGAAIAFSGH